MLQAFTKYSWMPRHLNSFYVVYRRTHKHKCSVLWLSSGSRISICWAEVCTSLDLWKLSLNPFQFFFLVLTIFHNFFFLVDLNKILFSLFYLRFAVDCSRTSAYVKYTAWRNSKRRCFLICNYRSWDRNSTGTILFRGKCQLKSSR